MQNNRIQELPNITSDELSEKIAKAYKTGFSRGYDCGYRNGMLQTTRISSKNQEDDILSLPIESLNLSTRAFNCLHLAGYVHLCDIAKLSEQEIIRIRGMGILTLKEIAGALREYGIGHTQWEILSMRQKL